MTYTKYFIYIVLILSLGKICGQTNTGPAHKQKSTFGGLKGNVKQFLEEHYTAEYKSDQVVLGSKLNYEGKRIRLKIFDRNGNCIRTNAYGLDNKISTFSITQYDHLGCSKETRYYCCDSILKSWIVNECDGQGNDLGGTRYKADSSMVDSYIWHYDDNNYLIETLEYKAGVLQKKATYQYDQSGNETELFIFDAKDNLVGMYKREFDSKGNKVVERLYSKQELYSTKNMKYDDMQNVIEEITIDANNKTTDKISYQYTYDEKGNWIERIEFALDLPKFVTIRKIQYYD